MAEPRGAVIEIVEKRREPMDTPAGDVIVPNEVRINGQPLLVPEGHPVKVHGIELVNRDEVLVTLTLFARHVVISAEEPTETEEEVQQHV
ncbi:hypothetical protein BDK92_7249 [Micromonospora pisi]|uniref:Uncharacterized protein n=1 Tax=Micromonospora pisi TaxID=589240 RepID=A0A495JX59_9ACTN|nr:hypothetical protein [Micromonospora pisi]RKR92769.1 hypothetical protein BDK92_7249 [Micromonospora pisi]